LSLAHSVTCYMYQLSVISYQLSALLQHFVRQHKPAIISEI
jgi:hypothetical protein